MFWRTITSMPIVLTVLLAILIRICEVCVEVRVLT